MKRQRDLTSRKRGHALSASKSKKPKRKKTLTRCRNEHGIQSPIIVGSFPLALGCDVVPLPVDVWRLIWEDLEMSTALLKSVDAKLAIHPVTGAVVVGFTSHAEAIGVKQFDSWVRAIVFPKRKRVYFRFYKPDGDYSFVSDEDKAKSFDVCFTAWEALVKSRYVLKSWRPLFAVTDKVVTQADVRF